jgi:hypothetical protein
VRCTVYISHTVLYTQSRLPPMMQGPTLDTPLDDAAWLDEFNTDTSTTSASTAAAAAAAAKAARAKPEVAHSWAAASAAAAAVQPSPLRIGGRFAKRGHSGSGSADNTAAATAATGDAAGGVLLLAAAVARDVQAEPQQQQLFQHSYDSPSPATSAGILAQVSLYTIVCLSFERNLNDHAHL